MSIVHIAKCMVNMGHKACAQKPAKGAASLQQLLYL